ncbi:dTDP-4-amino-4,6-dideoxyglucose formyltransferase [Acidiluteibacter ferrifornacis]|uniref:dTDP-4-amino-4,6-dideoxyglucose formyltransferase n=1 Tax=Acidiluteibacter ferrifornacis TaxID=2692424 RepID=A0A6N9NNG6_9FLAO|nr:dTDP-4-amino-4,6-dideoxyglucose formyltransferase [Acidiluteibacter ferrifornacis]NBG66647.1 dTDP-4-amino-4,6-dideoxyglucose formyltransferase [Acidiluteibacter ferrifornacis]
MRVLVLSDNVQQYIRIKKLFQERDRKELKIDYKHSPIRSSIWEHEDFNGKNLVINVKRDWRELLLNYDLIISMHCMQLFPKELVEGVRCINIHPGYNPVNRGWYPQVFAIIHDTIIGATIHEMDEKLDHGPIIAHETVPKYLYDTSIDIYNRVLSKEIELFEKYFDSIIDNTYITNSFENQGKVYLKRDFIDLCELELDEKVTYREVINRLRALTHGDYKNAYFFDEEGRKVYVSVNLELDE